VKALALLAGLTFLTALPIAAADPDFYHRTKTAPPGEWVAGPTLGYAMQLQPGVALGYRWSNGIQFLGSASLLRLDAQDGSVPYQVGCRTFYADYTTGGHTQAQVGVTVLFPLKALTKRAP